MNDRRRREDRFVNEVLQRTSGSPCARAEGLLPDLVAHQLEDVDRQLVQAHLEHCYGCRQVALTMGWLGSLLPGLAELDPGPAFTARVLARTTGALSPAEREVRAGGTIGLAGLMDRVGRWWERQIMKPQFALQFAYAATVILVLLTALPISPLRGTPEKALEVMQAGPGSLPLVGQAMVWTNVRVNGLVARPRAAIEEQWQGVVEDLDRRRQRMVQPRQAMEQHLGEAVSRLSEGELSASGYALIQTARSGQDVWRAWWGTQDNRAGP
jgi:hypothetical protein|nr:zf-HC2 domain-containing protein [Candidatus Krumholzibacteria bacterium]